LVALVFPGFVLASNVFLTEVSVPYEVVTIDTEVSEAQLHLGELDNFPIMYEFSLSATTSFVATISQPPVGGSEPNPLTLMLVRRDDRGGGVTEIDRLNFATDDWFLVKDSSMGVSLLEGDEISTELVAGLYRVEVSTPDNYGKYLLSFGPPADNGYFANLAKARSIQKFLGYSPLKMLTSSLVYYPLGIILLGILLQRTWRYRKMITNAS